MQQIRPDVKFFAIGMVLATVASLIGFVMSYVMIFYIRSPIAMNYLRSVLVERVPNISQSQLNETLAEVISIARGLGYYLLGVSVVGLALGLALLAPRSMALNMNFGGASSASLAIGVILIIVGVMSIIDIIQLVLYIAAGAMVLHERTLIRRAEALAASQPAGGTNMTV
ncbi:hypothetical protein ASAC_0851 [Acidilobus saccharovorans 345-15]|uniref:Uncharacterized protein n=1 Tax=Acidilobus saccharovorans (strain DSM 16705 / JCM 18335 / VKM B-2471 / 345-15) TaxID=666510 RepID=D9Q1R9_ACIS3|nr:hypothetical protein [Acidilobus saccharovorans]ADL19257.1 hypothetical protein ASAC_0851 [Acidilobus saccharovorans 345-15]